MGIRMSYWFCLLVGVYVPDGWAQTSPSYGIGSGGYNPFLNGYNTGYNGMSDLMKSLDALNQMEKMLGGGPTTPSSSSYGSGTGDAAIAQLERRVDTLEQMLSNVGRLYEGNFTDPVIAFTAMHPQQGYYNSRELSFERVLTNEGTDFSEISGQFTCSTPGLYYFITHLVKYRSMTVDFAGCHIMLNGDILVRAFIDPEDQSDNGSYGFSNSVFVRLNFGDVVKLGECSGPDPSEFLDDQSSFSGFLVHANK